MKKLLSFMLISAFAISFTGFNSYASPDDDLNLPVKRLYPDRVAAEQQKKADKKKKKKVKPCKSGEQCEYYVMYHELLEEQAAQQQHAQQKASEPNVEEATVMGYEEPAEDNNGLTPEQNEQYDKLKQKLLDDFRAKREQAKQDGISEETRQELFESAKKARDNAKQLIAQGKTAEEAFDEVKGSVAVQKKKRPSIQRLLS